LRESKNAWMESVRAAVLPRPWASLPGGFDLHAMLRRRTLLIAAIAALALVGSFMLFRSSPLVAVDQVRIVGVRGVQAAPVSEALETTAKQMSTMDYSVGALQAAVARYRVVRSIRVRTSFPHRMTIEVLEQLPVAQLSAGAMRSAVAADGVVLGPALASRALPAVHASVIPAAGKRVSDWRLRSYLTVLGAAPVPLLPLVSHVFTGQQGLTVKMANGLLIYFGDDSRPHAKWDALVTVLIAQGSAGANYVDVRLPERAAAGMSSGGVGSGESNQVSASDPTSAALAASLARAVNGESSTSGTTPSASGTAPTAGGVSPSGASASGEASASSGGAATSAQPAEGIETASEGG
jgi:cell division protein FtsQ